MDQFDLDQIDRVVNAIGPSWRSVNNRGGWEWLQAICFGAGLAQEFGSEAESDFYLLRDIAAEHAKECEK
jgi:hypothetical protein